MKRDTTPSRAILFLRSSRRCTGLERRILLLAEAAQSAGFAPHIGVFYRQAVDLPAEHPLVSAAHAAGLPATQIADPGPLSGMRGLLRSLRDLVETVKPAIVHTQDYRTDIAAFLTISRRNATSSHVTPRLIATAHGHTGADWKLNLYERLDRHVLRRFDRVICASRYQCRAARSWGLSEHQIVYLPHPIEPDWEQRAKCISREEARRQWDVSDAEFAIGFLGRDSREKGLDVLLAAFRSVHARRPGVRLLVAGDIRLAGRQRAAAAVGVQQLGYQADPRSLLMACDVIVIPSRVEAFGLAALEALALGRPVIATRVGGLPEIVRDGETGRLVAPDDAGALAEAIIGALDNWPATLERARRGQEDILARYDPAAILPQAIRIYYDLLDRI